MSLCLLLAFLSGCTVWHEHAVSDWTDATGGAGLEKVYWKEVKAKNWTELERHLAGNYVAYTPEEGRMDRAAMMQHLQKLQLDDYSLGNLETELSGETFVVTYDITLKGTFAGQPLPAAPIRMMTVWQRQKRNWAEIAHSVMGPAGK
jgi:hypothetical protein